MKHLLYMGSYGIEVKREENEIDVPKSFSANDSKNVALDELQPSKK